MDNDETDVLKIIGGRCSGKQQQLIKAMSKDFENKIHFHMGQAYMFRGMLEAFLKASTITFEELESGPCAHIKLDSFEETWTGPGVLWLKMHYDNKIMCVDKTPESLKLGTYIQWSGTGLKHPKGFKKEEKKNG